MIKSKIKGKFFPLVIMMVLSIFGISSTASYAQSVSRSEKKADNSFMQGNYNKGMRYYERALSDLEEGSAEYYKLELKIAYLYSLLQDKPKTVKHYDHIFQNADTILSLEDIYLFADALRRSNLRQHAEQVIRHYAFKGTYHRNQRFMNTLNSLSNQSYYYQSGLSSYKVRQLDGVSKYSNYWMGEYDSQIFFAQSHSEELTSNDKIIYHQTRYRKLSKDVFGSDVVFNDIPLPLQQGPMAYSKDRGLLVVTDVSYKGSDEKTFTSTVGSGFSSNLLFSYQDNDKGRWGAFKPLFTDIAAIDETYSYAHPTFFNDGKSLMFSSDRLGGYGGMDVYITNWNEATSSWDEPLNLGTQVNTEGDELYPRIFGDALFFASNGHEGFGGLDNYRISFGNNIILPGTLFHYPYPVNSAFNDFGVYFHEGNGFFVSDRQENGRDDIFVLMNVPTSLSREGAIGVSKEYIAMRGNLDIVEQMASGNTLEQRSDVNLREYIDKTVTSQVFFDFDSRKLTATTEAELSELLESLNPQDIEKIVIVGYADLIGSREYNKHLSLQRAEKVAKYFQKYLPETAVEYKGGGVIDIPDHEKQDIEDHMRNMSLEDINYKALSLERKQSVLAPIPNRQAIINLFERYRRVEIVVKNKHNYNK